MARKAKKKVHKMPPLSFVDKLIYWLMILVLCAAYLALVFGPLHLRNVIAFADDAVIAVEDHFSLAWFLVPFLTFFLMTFILWYHFYQDRRPIFGKRNFKYGPPAWPHVYPLFMKNKPYFFVSERQKMKRKQLSIVLVVVLLISFIPFPWSLYGRSCLQRDGSIVQYNMFNQQTHDFTPGEIEEIRLETYSYHRRRSLGPHWSIRMTLITDSGKEYTFQQREFREGFETGFRNSLGKMLNVKRRYIPEIIRYAGVEYLHNVIADNRLSEEEITLLYQLFERN